ncbi:MAG: hypothetical protein SVM86_01250 [Candidatus Cloacimonadota bacterium]|nr:hypothetical protein [Candidatus Cloacimonadota bacterium]
MDFWANSFTKAEIGAVNANSFVVSFATKNYEVQEDMNTPNFGKSKSITLEEGNFVKPILLLCHVG